MLWVLYAVWSLLSNFLYFPIFPLPRYSSIHLSYFLYSSSCYSFPNSLPISFQGCARDLYSETETETRRSCYRDETEIDTLVKISDGSMSVVWVGVGRFSLLRQCFFQVGSAFGIGILKDRAYRFNFCATYHVAISMQSISKLNVILVSNTFVCQLSNDSM